MAARSESPDPNFSPSDNNSTRVVLLNDQQWSYLQRRYRMTVREFEIARQVCQGFSNEEIAHELRISLGTVKTHIRNIYRKTWARNKIDMLLRFVGDANVVYGNDFGRPSS